jgi:AmmeMemoRadiSam system protein B
VGRAAPAGDHPEGEDRVTGDRPPAVAGAFYPADPSVLASTVDKLLDTVDIPDDDKLAPAYVVPHAGYRYSGATAAHVYARLRRHSIHIGRIVLVGPAHRVRLAGCAAPTTARWLTPLGPVPIAPAQGVAGLAADDAPHAPEHSLEVQLPFLQRAVPGVPVLPIVVGVSTVDTVAAVIEAVAPDAVLLCSTDLSHYHPDAEARQQDERTARAVEALRPDLIGVRDACGVFALRGTVEWARRAGLRARRLALTTSADSGGDPGRVVGYPAFAFA